VGNSSEGFPRFLGNPRSAAKIALKFVATNEKLLEKLVEA
jgi:hypothetical protein